jgi:hypothetical protein
LLPFIDETRLLQALKPTISQWTEKELLCNIRGQHEGYIFFHSSHNVAILLSSDKLVGGSLSLDQYCDRKVFGKLHKLDRMKDWSFGDQVTISHAHDESVLSHNFSESVFDPITCNQAVCGIFMEPPKRIHRSVLIQGVMLSPPVLTEDDKRIRRPRLNGRGGTIANLGYVAQQQSHQMGYGSMNISSYERELAERTGRGHQMNQTGIRSWGSMEPAQKKFHSSQPLSLNTQSQMKSRFTPPQQYVPPSGYTTTNPQPQRILNASSAAPPPRWVPPNLNTAGPPSRNPLVSMAYLPPPPPPPLNQPLPHVNTHRSVQQNPHSNFSYSHRVNTPIPPLPPHQRYPISTQPSQGHSYSANSQSQVHVSVQDDRNKEGRKLSESKMHSLRAQLAKTLQQNQRGAN